MKDCELRKTFIAWIKATSWHPCGLGYVLGQEEDGEFSSYELESMFSAYCAGVRKGIKLQKLQKLTKTKE